MSTNSTIKCNHLHLVRLLQSHQCLLDEPVIQFKNIETQLGTSL